MPYVNPSDPIGNSEKALLHVAKAELKLDDIEYQAILWGAARVTSSKDLDYKGYWAVRDRLKELGFKARRPPRKRRPPLPPNMVEMITPAQRDMINHLREHIQWRAGADMGWKWFLLRRFKIREVKTKKEAQKVIEALKRMSKPERSAR